MRLTGQTGHQKFESLKNVIARERLRKSPDREVTICWSLG